MRTSGAPIRLAIVMLILTASHAARADRLERRGSESALEGTVSRVDDNGVTMRAPSGAEHVVTWDRVREVITNDPSVERQVAEHGAHATSLWRARMRLERGDSALAEPLFERLFAHYLGSQQHKVSHETALIAAEGLLRCRLTRGANDTAVVPALEVARLRRKGVTTTAFVALPAMWDEGTGLCPLLPPAWVSSSALDRIDADLEAFNATGDTVVAAQAAWYRAAIRQLENDDTPLPQTPVDQPGVALLAAMVTATGNDGAARESSRTALAQRVNESPLWIQAWCHYAIGRSLLRESGALRQQSGLVRLARLPASYRGEQPYLAALALAIMACELQLAGDAEAAVAMRSELARTFPQHPALRMTDADWASHKGASATGPNNDS